MVELRGIIVSSLLIGLFVFAMVNLSIHFTSQNSVNNTLMENEVFNSSFGKLQSELESSQAIAQAQREVQEETAPTTSPQDVLLESTPKSAFKFTSLARNLFNLTFEIISKTLGIPREILYIITAIVIITFVMLIWSYIRSGR